METIADPIDWSRTANVEVESTIVFRLNREVIRLARCNFLQRIGGYSSDYTQCRLWCIDTDLLYNYLVIEEGLNESS